jgi:hypothetical protein
VRPPKIKKPLASEWGTQKNLVGAHGVRPPNIK